MHGQQRRGPAARGSKESYSTVAGARHSPTHRREGVAERHADGRHELVHVLLELPLRRRLDDLRETDAHAGASRRVGRVEASTKDGEDVGKDAVAHLAHDLAEAAPRDEPA